MEMGIEEKTSMNLQIEHSSQVYFSTAGYSTTNSMMENIEIEDVKEEENKE